MSRLAVDRAWALGKLKYKLYPLQKVIYDKIRETDSMWTFLECGRGFSKSYLMTMMAIEDCIRGSEFPFAIIGPEIKQQTRIMTQTLAKIGVDAPPGMIRKRRSDAEVEIGDNTLYIAGFNRDSIERLRGLRLGGVYLDEARNCDAEEFLYGLNDILIPTLAHANGRIIVGSSTPSALDHPLISYIAPAASKAGTHFVYTIDDNPTLTQSQKETMIENMGGIESDAVQRELYCKRIRPKTRVVLPDFRNFWEDQSQVHLDYGNWLVFGDTGGTRDKTWIGIGYYDHPTARLHVVDEEWFDVNTPSGDVALGIGRLKGRLPVHVDDVSHKIDMAGQTIIDYREIHKLSISAPVKLEFNQSINKLNMAFRSTRIAIHPRCKNLLLCCEYGLLNKLRNDFERSKLFGHCDPIAGLKYGWSSCDTLTNRWPQEPSAFIVPKHMQQKSASQALSGLLGGRR